MSHMRKPRRRRRGPPGGLAGAFVRGWMDGKRQWYGHMVAKHADELTAKEWDWCYRHGVAWECCKRPVADATVEVVGQPAPAAAPAPLELTEWSSQWLDSPNWPELPEWGSSDCPHRTVDSDGEIW